MHDERGVSTVISHILALGIVAILVVGLITSVGGLLEGQQATARAEGLDAVGNRVASDVATADRLATAESSFSIDASGPRSVAGGQYTVRLAPGPTPGEATLYVSASGSDTSTEITLDVKTTVREGRAAGDSVSVVVEDGELTIEGQ
jgi:hypothetical protein